MELVYLHFFSVLLYLGLLIFSALKRLKINITFIIAIVLTIFWLSQSIYNNYETDSYYLNYYSVTLSLFGWMIFLQSAYLKIPNTQFMRLMPVIGINLLLIAIFAYQFRLNGNTQTGHIHQEALFFSNFIISIAMLFFLENIVRCLKINYRYAHKHLLFALFIMALVNLVNYYQLFSSKEIDSLFHYLSLFIHVVVPLFLFISINRQPRFKQEQFISSEVSQLQYFLILVGSLLMIAGILQMFDLYFSQVRSDFYQSLFLIIIISGTGILFLSDRFRSELSLYLKSYFYGDRNDYRKEWAKVSAITREQEAIHDKVMQYFSERLGASASALYIYDQGAMRLMVARGNGFEASLVDFNALLQSGEKLSNNVISLQDPTDGYKTEVIITLNVEDDLIGIFMAQVSNDYRFIDSASLELCDTVSDEFAIRLWEIRHRKEIQRQDKLTTFNRTVAFLVHDLKNIAAQQKLAMENFSKYRDDPEFLDDFGETIDHSTERLGDLISQIRDSSLNDKKKQITLDKLKQTIEQKVRLFGQPIEFIFDNPTNQDRSISSEVVKIIENLIKNASEASQVNDIIQLLVKIDDQLMIQVSDQGEGMTQDFIDNQLFEPFSSTKENEGLGVGMYHIKTILDAMSATIDVKSKRNQGTTVTVRIPV